MKASHVLCLLISMNLALLPFAWQPCYSYLFLCPQSGQEGQSEEIGSLIRVLKRQIKFHHGSVSLLGLSSGYRNSRALSSDVRGFLVSLAAEESPCIFCFGGLRRASSTFRVEVGDSQVNLGFITRELRECESQQPRPISMFLFTDSRVLNKSAGQDATNGSVHVFCRCSSNLLGIWATGFALCWPEDARPIDLLYTCLAQAGAEKLDITLAISGGSELSLRDLLEDCIGQEISRLSISRLSKRIGSLQLLSRVAQKISKISSVGELKDTEVNLALALALEEYRSTL